MSIENCQRWLKKSGHVYPRTCSECGLSGPCKYTAEFEAPEGDTDLAAARAVMQRASNEVVAEARRGNTTMTASKWWRLYESVCECWPELDVKTEK